MHPLARVGAVAVVGALLGIATVAQAADGDKKPPVITAVVTSENTVVGTTPETVTIPCTWYYGESSEEHAEVLNIVNELVVTIIGAFTGIRREVTIIYYYEDSTLRRWSTERARFESWQVADCSRATHPSGVSSGDSRWVIVDPPDPRIILARSVEEATKTIEFPAPDISPPNDSAVNLGLWLAVEPQGPFSARAELGPVWAETTATLVTTSFDPGNGAAPVMCDGYGTPIPPGEEDSIEQGPCGYTYPADTDGETITMTVTSTWEVTWELSDGTVGSEPDIIATTQVPYEVYEIQTVGTRG